MRVLFINSVYKEKSTGVLVHSIEEFLQSKGHQTMVVYGRGKKTKEAVKIQNNLSFLFNVFLSRISGYFWSKFAKKQTKKIIKVIEEYKPDIINIHQLYGFYLNASMLVKFIKENKLKTVITLHDFTIITGKCGHPLSCTKYLSACDHCPRKKEYPKSYFFDRTNKELSIKIGDFSDAPNISFVAVSDWLKQKTNMSPIINNHSIKVINNGISTELYRYREKEDDNEYKNILIVSSNFKDKIKGSTLLIETINEMTLLSNQVRFVLIGKHSDYIVKKAIKGAKILSLGECNKKTVSNWYNKSGCLFIPSEAETFSLPTVEALCSGLPVFGPKDCGAPTTLFNNQYCNFKYNRDGKELAKAMFLFLNKHFNKLEFKQLSQIASDRFNINEMCNNYLKLFGEVLDEK